MLRLYEGVVVKFADIQDVIFYAPVEVGSGLVFDSMVSYTEGSQMVVKVTVVKLGSTGNRRSRPATCT